MAAAAPGDMLYVHPGKLVPTSDGARLNLVCTGTGSPAVVFDSGWEDWSPVWAIVQPRVAGFTRACSHDRAGAGFSEPGPMPRVSVRIAGELRDALRNAGIPGPYILVGHAFGGDNVRTFAALYPQDIAGLVLVEGDSDELEPQDLQDVDHAGNLEGAKDLRACGQAVAQHLPLPPLTPRPDEKRTCAQQFFRGLPEAMWSPELNAKLLQIATTKTAMYEAYASEREHMADDEAWLRDHPLSLGARPLRVVSTGNHGVGSLDQVRTPSLAHLRYEYETTLAQSRWLAASSNARQVFAHHSSEYVPFDEPDTVVDAIREVFDQGRTP